MAAANWNPADFLVGAQEGQEPEGPAAELLQLGKPVLRAARRSTFFTTISLFERLTPGSVRIGGDGPINEERLRFRHDPAMSFSAGDISHAKVAVLPKSPERSLLEDIAVFEVMTTFLGLTGAASPLPLYMVEEVLHEDDDSPVRRHFLDIFHHRLLSLLYRSVMKYMPAREHVTTKDDVWMLRALALGGLDPEIQTVSDKIPRHTLVRLIPLLSGRGRNTRTTQKATREILGDLLGVVPEVSVRELAGGWIKVDEDQQMSLGAHNCELGLTAILGQHTYDRAGRFAMRVGPLTRKQYRRFLKDGDLLPVVKEIVHLSSKESLDYDLELLLRGDEVPTFVLSRSAETILGRDTHLRSNIGGEGFEEIIVIRDVESAIPD
jgi:type VI secretion system protein ImpH